MDLNTVCFLLFGFLFTGYLLLEGFGYGVSMLLPFISKSDIERQAVINTLAPVWEGNEVWLVAAGAVLFAGFPGVYATLFSGLYLALLLLLTTLIIRGVAFAFRDQDTSPQWRNFWDWAIFCGGVIPALLWGIALADLIKGLPINDEMQYNGTVRDLLSLYSLTGGFVLVSTFLLHGATYLTLRLNQHLSARAWRAGIIVGKYALLITGGFTFFTFAYTDLTAKPLACGVLAMSVAALSLCCRYLGHKQFAYSFGCSTASIFFIVGAIFIGLFPRVIVSDLRPDWSLNIYNSSANPVSLEILTTAMLIILPVILAFESWKYYIFRHRISIKEINFESRRKLWEQLHRQLTALIRHSYDIGAICAKAGHSFLPECSIKIQRRMSLGIDSKAQELSVLTRRGQRMIAVFTALIKLLKKP